MNPSFLHEGRRTIPEDLRKLQESDETKKVSFQILT